MFLHFSGYEAWTMDQIKLYHSTATSGSMAAGHPEIEYPGKLSGHTLSICVTFRDRGYDWPFGSRHFERGWDGDRIKTAGRTLQQG